MHGFHHMTNNKFPQLISASVLYKEIGGTAPIPRPWYIYNVPYGLTNVPWPTVVCKVRTLKFVFEVRWLCGTFLKC